MARDKSTRQTHSSWEHPNAQYWSQFHHVRPQGPQARQQQHKYNQQVLRYCLLLMLAGMGLHYVVFRMVERMHLNFMDEKDRIITAMYNEARARARANRASLQQKQQWQKQQQPPPPGPTQGPEIVPPGSGP